jgi:hypothetical protein
VRFGPPSVGVFGYPSSRAIAFLARWRIVSAVRLRWLHHRVNPVPLHAGHFCSVGFAVGLFIWCFSGAAAGRIASSAAPCCPRVWQVQWVPRPARQRTDGPRC